MDHDHGFVADRGLGGGRRAVVDVSSSQRRGEGRNLGLRLRRSDSPHAVHVVFLRSDAGLAVRLGASSPHTQAQGVATLPAKDRIPE